jgi:hypothetical protein
MSILLHLENLEEYIEEIANQRRRRHGGRRRRKHHRGGRRY